MHRGYVVSIPVEPVRYDLVVESDEGLMRVQVKSTTSKDHGRWIVRIDRQKYGKRLRPSSNGARQKCTYLPDEIDYFFVVTGDGDKYLIPLSETNEALSLTLDSKYAVYRV
jgi:hypothetical protein